jgi:predicted transcriptional regulator
MRYVQEDVTDAELNVLGVLWEQGPSTLRQLAEALYPRKAFLAAQATVLKLLERLEAKQYVKRQKGDGPQQFLPLVNRDELIGLRLQTLADQLCDGALTPILTNLVRAKTLSAKERQELQALLKELQGQK